MRLDHYFPIFTKFKQYSYKVKAYPFWKHLRAYRHRYLTGFVALMVVDLINVLLPLLVREAVDALTPKAFHRIVWAGVGYFLLMAIQAVGRYLWRVHLIGTSHLIAQKLRMELYQHLQRLPLRYYHRVRTGDLMSRATNDIESIRMAVGPGILVTLDAVLMFLFIIPVMFYLSPKLTLLAFAFYPVVPFLTARLGDRIDTLFESLQTKMSSMSAFAQESFHAIRLIKSLVLESRAHERFNELSRLYEKEGMQLAKYQAVFSPSLSLLTNLGTFLILFSGGMDVMAGVVSVGTFVAFQRFVVQLSWPMEAIGWAVTMNREGRAAYSRMNEILNAPQVESVRSVPKGKQPYDEILSIKGLERQEAHFRLKLDHLTIQRGQKIGVVGKVGAGKSTLFHLILRLHEPPIGTVFFQGQDVTSIPLLTLRRQIASVEQHVFLFSENIRQNILLGTDTVPEEKIRAVTQVACIEGELLELASGFDSKLGERGVNLSGGQKQRVALSRALVREPVVLLLDDCFSAVDVEIENRIIENFFAGYPELSLCFASHRLSVMPRMDEIWLLENGTLLDRGTHASLLKRNALYASLWEKSERQIELEKFEPPTEVERADESL